VNASTPPLINWSTKPKGDNRETDTLDGSQGPSSTAMAQAESATDDSGDAHQLQLLLHHLSHSTHAVSRRTVNNQQDSAESLAVESNGVDIPVATSNPMGQQDEHRSSNESFELLGLTGAFSHLVTFINPARLVPLVPRAPPSFPPYSSTYQQLLNMKYYVVVKGKCTGIYYGKWYVCINF